MVFDWRKSVIWKAPAKLRGVRMSFLAGNLAVHAVIALVPFVVMLYDVLLWVGSGELATRWVRGITSSVSPRLARLLVTEPVTATEVGGISVVGLVVMIVALIHLSHGLHEAFAILYKTTPPPTLLD